MKILIIGAGPTGLSTALELAHGGLKPELVEKRSGPSEFSRAVGNIPITRYNLRHGGVGDAILKEAVPWRKFAFYRGDKTLLDLDLSTEVKPEECILGLPQDRTEGLIRDALAGMGVETKYNTEATKVETTDDRAKVTFADGQVGTYDWVIACDGKHSAMREQLGIPYEGYDLEDTWSIADIDMSENFDCEQCSFWIQGKTVTLPPACRSKNAAPARWLPRLTRSRRFRWTSESPMCDVPATSRFPSARPPPTAKAGCCWPAIPLIAIRLLVVAA